MGSQMRAAVRVFSTGGGRALHKIQAAAPHKAQAPASPRRRVARGLARPSAPILICRARGACPIRPSLS